MNVVILRIGVKSFGLYKTSVSAVDTHVSDSIYHGSTGICMDISPMMNKIPCDKRK